MTSELKLKEQMVEIGRRIWVRGFVASHDGNITLRLNDDEFLTTPTGVSKGFMTTKMIIKCDKTGKAISGGKGFHPSSEIKMHLDVYKERPDVFSAVHAHPPYATSFAVAGIPLNQCVLPEAIIVIGSVPIAPYGLPSSMELPDRIRPFIQNSDAILLANHGALTVGSDVFDAYHKMETLELAASIVWKAIQLGNVNVLPPEERDRLMALRDQFNLRGRVSFFDAAPSSSTAETGKIGEKSIREIAAQVIAALKRP